MRLLVSALEPSSNLHLAALVRHFHGSVELVGVFDSAILPGSKPLYQPSDFSVMGFVDVLKRIFFFMRVQQEMVALARGADKILLMDASSFNIPLAKRIKKSFPSKEIIYYILPQVWAWKPWRSRELERHCDRLAAILPFEVGCYQMKAEYVGHPLLDELPPARACPPTAEKIAFMPGSREGEISKLFPIFLELSRAIDAPKILIVPASFSGRNLGEIYGDVSGFTISYSAVDGLLDASFAFICSGTATLEAALLGVPFVLAYRARPLDFWLVKNLARVSHAGLANIFSLKMGRPPLHEEVLQGDVTVARLLEVYHACDRRKFIEGAEALRSYLGHGSSQKVARWVLD